MRIDMVLFSDFSLAANNGGAARDLPNITLIKTLEPPKANANALR